MLASLQRNSNICKRWNRNLRAPKIEWIVPFKTITISNKYLVCRIYPFLKNIYLFKIFAQLVVWLNPDTYWKPSLTNKMQLFGKCFILDVLLGSECTFGIKIAFLFSVVLLVYFLISNEKYTWSRYFKPFFFWGKILQSSSNQISELSGQV